MQATAPILKEGSMTEQEKLEKVADIANVPVAVWSQPLNGFILATPDFHVWNPRVDDGDNRRLVVAMEMELGFRNGVARAQVKDGKAVFITSTGDHEQAMRDAVIAAILGQEEAGEQYGS